MKSYFTLSNSTTIATMGLLGVFLLDMFTPLGIAIGILYTFCLFLVCSQEKKTIIIFAIILSLLTIVKFIFFLSVETNYMSYTNRGITLIVIWLVAILAIRHRTLIEKTNTEKADHINELERMLFITNHKMRQPVANCLGLMNVLDFENPSKEDIMKIYEHIKRSAQDLDKFSKDLNNYLFEMGKKHKYENMRENIAVSKMINN